MISMPALFLQLSHPQLSDLAAAWRKNIDLAQVLAGLDPLRAASATQAVAKLLKRAIAEAQESVSTLLGVFVFSLVSLVG